MLISPKPLSQARKDAIANKVYEDLERGTTYYTTDVIPENGEDGLNGPQGFFTNCAEPILERLFEGQKVIRSRGSYSRFNRELDVVDALWFERHAILPR